MSQYGRAEYWQERYSRDPGPFDWYQRYFALREIIGANIPVEFRILNVGSGNSRLSEEMFDDGYENITNIDISQTSIKAMNELYKEKGANFKYIQMDVRAMEFAENSFDAVIDKGTFDSVVCGEGSNTNASKMLTEVYRVLGPNGVYVMITFGNSEARMEYLRRKEFEWGIWVHKLVRPTVTAQITPSNAQKDDKNHHFIYVCVKGKKNEQGTIVVEEKKEEKNYYMHCRKHAKQDLRESLQLTAQLERSLRKLLTSKKNLREVRDVCEVDDEDFMVVTESKDRELERMRVERKELLTDNEMLSREILAWKEEVRELKKEVASYKKYVKFLQDYNADLKREMVFWMSKPSKLDIPTPQLAPPNLMTEVLKLRSQNETRQKQLASLKNTLDYLHADSPSFQTKQFKLQPMQSKQLHKKSQTSKMKSKHCTSCSYSKQFGQPAVTRKKSSGSVQKKGKKLCDCHKRYIETSQFMC